MAATFLIVLVPARASNSHPPPSHRPVHLRLCAVQPELPSHLEVHTRRDPKALPRFLVKQLRALNVLNPEVVAAALDRSSKPEEEDEEDFLPDTVDPRWPKGK